MFWAVKWLDIDIEMGIPKCGSQKIVNTLKMILETRRVTPDGGRKRFDGGL